MLRPLVEQERIREQRERARSVESQKTRKRLNALEKGCKPVHGRLLGRGRYPATPEGREKGQPVPDPRLLAQRRMYAAGRAGDVP